MAQTLARPTAASAAEASLYDTDFVMWIEEQVQLLRTGQLEKLDIENVAEELDSMGRRDRRSIKSHLSVIQAHLLKLQFQPEARSTSWLRSISNSRGRIAHIVEDSPSLLRELPMMLIAAYPEAVRDAMIDTGLPRIAFPAEPPFDLEEVLNQPIEDL